MTLWSREAELLLVPGGTPTGHLLVLGWVLLGWLVPADDYPDLG